MKRIVQTQVAGHTVKYVPMILENNPSGIPLDYTEVEYLESTGTQYIDTGISFGDTSHEYKMSGDIDFSVNNTRQLQGAYLIAGGPYFGINENREWELGPEYRSSIRAVAGTMSSYVFTFAINRTAVLYVDNILAVSRSGVVHNDSNVQLFRIGSVSVWTNFPTCAKQTNVKLYDNNILVRHFIPCIRNSDNKPGMYDKVTNTFFTNSGTGEFITGNILKYSKEGRFN